MSTTQPAIHRIERIQIVGGFLDGTKLNLSEGLNCLIGGRGTGKTTVLEFLRYALDTMPAEDGHRRERKRVQELVEINLAGGRLEVALQTEDGLRYVVTRSAGEPPLVLTEDGQPTDLSPHSPSLFQPQVFSQNEVEAIADSPQAQLELLDSFESKGIAAINENIEKLLGELADNGGQVEGLHQKIASLTDEAANLPVVGERLAKFGTGSGTDQSALNKAHKDKALRDREDRMLDAAQRSVHELSAALGSHLSALAKPIAALGEGDLARGPNAGPLNAARESLAACSQDVDSYLRRAVERLESERERLQQTGSGLKKLHAQQEIAYRKLIETDKEAQGQAQERAKLERQRGELLAKQRDLEEKRARLAELESQREDLLARISEQREERFKIRCKVAAWVTGEAQGEVRAQVDHLGNMRPYLSFLEDALKSSGLQRNLAARKLASMGTAELASALLERDRTRLAEGANLSDEQADKVLAAMANRSCIHKLQVLDMPDEPKIELRDGGTYKEAGSLSTGQKCTAILPILLLHSNVPLLVDQPEDNLDNRYICKAVVERLRDAKRRRQLVMVSHNPNVVILGEADRVFVLDSNGRSAHCKDVGTVDHCRGHILDLLEGGEEAFQQRHERYGY